LLCLLLLALEAEPLVSTTTLIFSFRRAFRCDFEDDAVESDSVVTFVAVVVVELVPSLWSSLLLRRLEEGGHFWRFVEVDCRLEEDSSELLLFLLLPLLPPPLSSNWQISSVNNASTLLMLLPIAGSVWNETGITDDSILVVVFQTILKLSYSVASCCLP
jgi:hypothetical protein